MKGGLKEQTVKGLWSVHNKNGNKKTQLVNTDPHIPSSLPFWFPEFPLYIWVFCHLGVSDGSNALPPSERPSAPASIKLFLSRPTRLLLPWGKLVELAAASSVCVRLSQRKLHDGEYVAFLCVENWVLLLWSWGLSFVALQQLAPIFTHIHEPLGLRFSKPSRNPN